MIMGDFIKKFFDIKFWKFILVGVINTLVGNGLQFVLFALFAWDRYEWGVWLASALGYLIGSIVSYFLNKYRKGLETDFTLCAEHCRLLRTIVLHSDSANQMDLYGE